VFGVINAALRAFVVGVVVGMLFAPRPGAETRRMLNDRLGKMINELLEIAALPPVQPAPQAAANGQTERPATKRTRPAEGPGARTA
jgi:hypothetical protein